MHSETQWCTLTYAPEFLPTGSTLVPSHLSYWVRSLRKSLQRNGQGTIRYFGVGEYGTKLGRPHYHVFLFGLSAGWKAEATRLWKYGHVMWAHDPVNTKIAEYTAGYTVKKEGKDREKLGSRHPEFSRMSLRPPVGAAWADKFGTGLADSEFFVAELAAKGFPKAVRIGGKMVPLGRTLSRYVRMGLGYAADPSEEEKSAAQWVREQLYVNSDHQAERSKRRLAGAARAAARQSIFAKKEIL